MEIVISSGVGGHNPKSNLESEALSVIKSILVDAGISYKSFEIDRMTRCICVSTDEAYDFVRVKMGPKSRWFTHAAEGYHGSRIKIDCPQDLRKYSNEIIASYKDSQAALARVNH